MPDIQVTDSLDTPVEGIKIDLTQPSSLVNYLKGRVFHFAVVPEFLALRDTPISQAAGAKPIRFDGKAQHAFQLGNTEPEISITPGAQTTIRANATGAGNLFEGDAFRTLARIPPNTSYLSVGFQGSLDLGVSGWNGDLTFGMDATAGVGFEYWKAFPLGAGEPTLGAALGQTISSFVIPADLADLQKLGENDIATVSGNGSLKVSGGVSVSITPNPLASVDLPLGAGSIAVKAGATAGLTATFTISGSYQVRARRKDAGTFELSFLREKGTSLVADLSVAGGIKATIGVTDLVAAVLGTISTADPTLHQALLADLRPAELATLAAAIKGGLNHSLQATADLVLSTATDDQAAFQYEIQPALLSPEASLAVHRAMDGDLTALTEMEEAAHEGGVLAPGIKMLTSVLSEMRKRGSTLKLNLIGILNYLTVSELIRNSEVVTDEVTGDVTIKETVTGNNISAIVMPLNRNEALRKAIFQSVLVTTSYRAGKAVSMPGLACEQVHFALNQSTNHQIMGDYLSWFAVFNLLTAKEKAAILDRFTDGGPSTCILRSAFADTDCESMFFDAHGNVRAREYYLEIGRQALRALLDPDHQAIDALRYRIVDDALWPKALTTGANVNLAPLVGLSTNDVRVGVLIGDVMDIVDWAEGMVNAAALVLDMRSLVGNAEVAALVQNNEFKKKRDALQKAMAAMVKASKARFEEPWGMVCLFWAAGSPAAVYGKATAQQLIVERGQQPALAASGD